jgi:NifU-like protein involved in Fe-S cluster formation
MYSTTIQQHATRPANRGELPNANAHGQSNYLKCGDHFQLHLRLEGDLITEAAFQAQACAPVIAMGSVGTQLLKGLTAEQALKLSAFQLDDVLGGLPPAKRHAILLFLDALHQAITHPQTE